MANKPTPVKLGGKFFSVRSGFTPLKHAMKRLENQTDPEILKLIETTVATHVPNVILFDAEPLAKALNEINVKTVLVSSKEYGPKPEQSKKAPTPEPTREPEPIPQPEPEPVAEPEFQAVAEPQPLAIEEESESLNYLEVDDMFTYRGTTWVIVAWTDTMVETHPEGYLTKKFWTRDELRGLGICMIDEVPEEIPVDLLPIPQPEPETEPEPELEPVIEQPIYVIEDHMGNVVKTVYATAQSVEPELEPEPEPVAQTLPANQVTIAVTYERDWTWIKIDGVLTVVQRNTLYKNQIYWGRRRQQYYAKRHVKPDYIQNLLERGEN